MLKIVRLGSKGIYQIVGTVAGQRVRESTGVDSEAHAEATRIKRENQLLEETACGKRYTPCFTEAVSL